MEITLANHSLLQASLFAKLGGVKMLLSLTQSSNFNGFASLATLLVRHVMEDPATLRAAIERVIRTSTSSSNQGSNTKEFHYLLKMLAPAACRSPELFQDLAREILRVDFNLLSKRGMDVEDDQRLLVKSIPANQVSCPPLQDVSQSVVGDLLNFLVQGDPEASTAASAAAAPVAEAMDSSSAESTAPGSTTLAANRTQVPVIRNSSSGDLQVAPKDTVIQSNASQEKEKATEEEPSKKKQPLLSKSAVCRLLAELVKSYGSCAKLITEHVYETGISDNVKEDSSALAYLLDELLVSKSDKDLGPLIKTLVAALASCNQHSDAQATLVSEVKTALSRALAWQESSQKHVKIQALTSLVSTMIESCPSSQSHHIQTGFGGYKQPQQFAMNNVVKIMLKRGLISDLARVAHSLDLSSPNVANTVNAALKPLEILTRIVNQPTTANALPTRSGGGKSRGVASTGGGGHGTSVEAATGSSGTIQTTNRGESAAASIAAHGNGAGTNTTNSEATRAQGDETVEPDPEATEHDISTAAESIEPNSESQLQTVEDGNDEVFDEMMDQLLERDSGQDPPILAEINIEHVGDEDREQHDSQMMTQDESQFEAQQMSQDEEERESHSSHSDTENEDDDDVHEEEVMEEDEDDDGEDDDDGKDEEEEDEEDDEDDDDDDEDGAPFDDDENDEIHELEDAILRYPLGGGGGENDGDDIDLMIYPDAADVPTATIHLDGATDRTRSVHLPLWSDLGMASAHAADASVAGGGIGVGNSHVTPSHPLLMGRTVGAGGGGAESGATGVSRAARTLQRQRAPGFRGYIHLNSRGGGNPTAPAIIQNFLGGGGGGVGMHQDLVSQGLRRGLLVDFGFAILDSLDEDLEGNVLSSSGGRAALNTIPAALVRWNEESRVIDGDSMHDCVTALKPSMLEVIEKAKEEELIERRAKKKKAQEEEEAKKKVVEAEKKREEQTSETDQQRESSAVETNAQSSAAATTSTEEPMAVSPPATIAVAGGEAPIAMTTNAATPIQQTISETAVQLAEGLANAISAGVVNFPGISTAATATTTTTASVAAAISAAAPFSTGALQVTVESCIQRMFQYIHLAFFFKQSLWQQPATTTSDTTASVAEAISRLAAAESPSVASINSIESSTTTGAAAPPDRGAGVEDASNPERKCSETPDVSMMSEPESRPEDNATGAAATASGPASFDGATTSTPRTEHLDNPENLPQTPERHVPQAGDSTPVVAAASTTEPVAGTSGTCVIAPSNNTDYAVILGMDVSDLPDGVDPSFLAALPDDMRQEVIDEQRRLQNIRQQAAQQQEQQGMQEVNPEFLAALPPNIQEEVLAQQRIEQQRQAAATANPDAPVDPGEFLQNLPAPLRQSVLADMEESQVRKSSNIFPNKRSNFLEFSLTNMKVQLVKLKFYLEDVVLWHRKSPF